MNRQELIKRSVMEFPEWPKAHDGVSEVVILVSTKNNITYGSGAGNLDYTLVRDLPYLDRSWEVACTYLEHIAFRANLFKGVPNNATHYSQHTHHNTKTHRKNGDIWECLVESAWVAYSDQEFENKNLIDAIPKPTKEEYKMLEEGAINEGEWIPCSPCKCKAFLSERWVRVFYIGKTMEGRFVFERMNRDIEITSNVKFRPIREDGKTLCNEITLDYSESKCEKWVPEVGQECEYSSINYSHAHPFILAGRWYQCTVIAIHDGFIWTSDNGLRELSNTEFRPIKTDREKFIERCSEISWSSESDTKIYGLLFDDGARFTGDCK